MPDIETVELDSDNNIELLEAIGGLNEAERKQLLRSLRGGKPAQHVIHHFSGKRVKFGYYSDPHVGEKHFSEKLWMQMLSYFKRAGITNVYCPGD